MATISIFLEFQKKKNVPLTGTTGSGCFVKMVRPSKNGGTIL